MTTFKNFVIQHGTGESNYCDACIGLYHKARKLKKIKPWKHRKSHCSACHSHATIRAARYALKRETRKELHESQGAI